VRKLTQQLEAGLARGLRVGAVSGAVIIRGFPPLALATSEGYKTREAAAPREALARGF
jgi:hypothetical protein